MDPGVRSKNMLNIVQENRPTAYQKLATSVNANFLQDIRHILGLFDQQFKGVVLQFALLKKNLLLSLSSRWLVFLAAISIMPETASEPSYYRSSIRVKRCMCEPCSGHRINQLIDAKMCPLFENNTHLVVLGVQSLLKEAFYSLKSNAMRLQKDLGADKQFNPYKIPDLVDIENSSIKRYLKKKTRPEQILHYSFARVVLVHSFIEEAKEILKIEGANEKKETPRFFDSELDTPIVKLTKVVCKLHDFTFILHVSKIRKGVCTYIKSINFTTRCDALNYVLSIFNYTETILDLVINDISDFDSPSVRDSCKYQCIDEIKLVCKEQRTKKRPKTRKQRRKCKDKGCKKRESRKKHKDNARKNKRRRNKKCREKIDKTKMYKCMNG